MLREDVTRLEEAMQMSYQAQLNEGMQPLELPATCDGGWGGYALYLFSSIDDRDEFVQTHAQTQAIEPFIKN